MFCPVGKSAELVMTDHQGIKVDDCLTGPGVWLDRGELDRLIKTLVQRQP